MQAILKRLRPGHSILLLVLLAWAYLFWVQHQMVPVVMPDMPGMDMKSNNLPNAVGFPYGFPSPGQYRIFVQMKRAGEIVTGVHGFRCLRSRPSGTFVSLLPHASFTCV